MCFVGGAQSTAFTVLVKHKPADWAIGFNIDLWSTLYSGTGSGLLRTDNLHPARVHGEERPSLLTIFNPLGAILVTVLAYFVLGEKLYVGR
ncbi:hypothetical protein CDL15_Pgr016306 [Punica granatum]|nr:hypothetical protein CDL15_Pgr016306 [Punica granatum]